MQAIMTYRPLETSRNLGWISSQTRRWWPLIGIELLPILFCNYTAPPLSCRVLQEAALSSRRSMVADSKRAWWRPESAGSVAWLALFVPGLACYLYFLSQHLNEYEEVQNSGIERLSPKIDDIIPPHAKVEIVADGFAYTEGPQWVNDAEAERQYLLFSDVPRNRIWKWEEGGGIFTLGKSLFLDRSGCRSDHCSQAPAPGSNGLALVPGSGEVIMCEHGDRRVTRMEKNGTKTALATHFNRERLNSPNDVTISKSGDIYFTDPPYGLPLRQEDPDFSRRGFGGVYRISRETVASARAGDNGPAEPELLERDFVFPNGLVFSPDCSKLYLAVSSPEEPAWFVYDVAEDGRLSNRRMFLDARPMAEGGRVGHPDGMKVDQAGNIFAAAPGGVAVISEDGEHLGTVLTGGIFVANVVIGGDGYLYMAASETILRIKVSAKAPPFGWFNPPRASALS